MDSKAKFLGHPVPPIAADHRFCRRDEAAVFQALYRIARRRHGD